MRNPSPLAATNSKSEYTVPHSISATYVTIAAIAMSVKDITEKVDAR